MTIETVVQNSSPNLIISSAERIKKSAFIKSRWLYRNIYRSDVIDTIKREDNSAPSKPNHLAQYIAASTVLHCCDGWKFFSLGMDNLLNGDSANSVFMAYYAQLRALMAYFATEGIGIFNNKHFYFDNRGDCFFFKSNTHDVVKNLINAWAQDKAKSPRFLNVLKLEGRPFSDWISSADVVLGSPTIPEVAKDWLQAWSIDLKILGEDHTRRNEVSYRPQGITKLPTSRHFENDLSMCLEAWKVTEPFAANRFAILDQILLRKILLAVYERRKTTRMDFEQFVATSMVNLGLGTDSRLYRVMTSSNPITNEILKNAEKTAFHKTTGTDPVPVLCRAFILLRIASAAVENFLEKSSISSSDIEFWWSNFGINNGLWTPGNPPEQMSDLWSDIDEAILGLEDFLDQADTNICVTQAHYSVPYELWQVKQFTKAGLWAIGL